MTEANMTFDPNAKPKRDFRDLEPKPKAKAKPKRTRATAKEQTKQRRRRREGGPSERGPLNLDKAKLDTENYHYRFADLNRPGRLQQLTQQDDYDIVDNTDGEQDSIGLGSDVRRPSGEKGMVLLRKPIEFYKEDQAARARQSKAVTDQLKQGSEGKKQLGKDTYIPEGGISINDS